MRATPPRTHKLGIPAALAAIVLGLGASGAAQATVFNLTATDIVFESPAPLFTSDTITGSITLDNAIAPGQSFGAASVTAIDLDFAGIIGDLASIQDDIAPGPVQLFGTRSADGRSFSVLDFRFGFAPSTPGCSFVCAGQILINSPIGGADPSNFIALDDFGAGDTHSVIDSFTPHFEASGAVPEPRTWFLALTGFALMGATLRRRRAATLARVAG